MVERKFKPEQIINMIRDAEVLSSQGTMVGEAGRKLGVTEQTYYRWRKEYGAIRIEQAKRLQELESENVQLRSIIIIRPHSSLKYRPTAPEAIHPFYNAGSSNA